MLLQPFLLLSSAAIGARTLVGGTAPIGVAIGNGIKACRRLSVFQRMVGKVGNDNKKGQSKSRADGNGQGNDGCFQESSARGSAAVTGFF